MEMNISRSALLRKIQELGFYAVDLNLYLDNFPNDEKALRDYNMASNQLRRLKNLYEERFAPLANYGESPSKGCWRWVEEPWPWEGEL